MSIDDLSPEERAELAYRIGVIALSLVPSAVQLGHVTPLTTLRDYVRGNSNDPPLQRMAREFLQELVSRPWGGRTESMWRRWFPGQAAERDAALAHYRGLRKQRSKRCAPKVRRKTKARSAVR